MTIKLLAVAACLSGFCIGTAASAATINLTEVQDARGEDMNFDFTGLGASDGSDGSLTLGSTLINSCLWA